MVTVQDIEERIRAADVKILILEEKTNETILKFGEGHEVVFAVRRDLDNEKKSRIELNVTLNILLSRQVESSDVKSQFAEILLSQQDVKNQVSAMVESQQAALAAAHFEALSVSRLGVSTQADWVTFLRSNGSLLGNIPSFTNFLHEHLMTWWPTITVPSFPPLNATETQVCQKFVTNRIDDIVNCGGLVHPRRKVFLPLFVRYSRTTVSVEFQSYPVDGHKVVSFANRKPDIVCYWGQKRGACAITIIGDVKGCASRNNDFPEADIGHILDMAKELMVKEQFARVFMICFLTDGYRFQFFRCLRSERGENFSFEQSVVYCGQNGWQIFFGLLISRVENLGFVSFDVPDLHLVHGLGKGRFSTVFSCRYIGNTSEVCVMKIFQADDQLMAMTELDVLNALRKENVTNIPVCKQLYESELFNALVLTPLGVPVLPCKVLVTPTMLVDLLRVVQRAHELGWIHRDIKPDNIFLDSRDMKKIILNDWSSSVRSNVECKYVGTPFFGEEPTDNMHIPTPRLDLECLVKTAFCLSKQYHPSFCRGISIVEHWSGIMGNFSHFREAMQKADAVAYDELAEVLLLS